MAQGDPVTLRWKGLVPAGVQLESLRVGFASTRTTFELVVLQWEEELAEGGPAAVEERKVVLVPDSQAPGSWSADFSPWLGSLHEADEELPVRLDVTFIGSTPRLTGIVASADKPVEMSPWEPEVVDVPEEVKEWVVGLLFALAVEQELVPATAAVGALGAAITHADVFQERQRAIQWDAKLRQTFFDHDYETNAGVQPDKWSAEYADLNDVLETRLRTYAHYGSRNPPKWVQYPPATGPVLDDLKKVSFAFRAHFEPLEIESSIDLFDWAFEHFVVGALVTRHNDLEWQDALINHGCPDSAFYLRYPVLAVMCIDSGVDADWWKARLATLVRTAHVFLEFACPLKLPPYPGELDDFRYNADRYYPRTRRAALRAEYDGLLAPLNASTRIELLRARLCSLLGLALGNGYALNNVVESTIPEAWHAKLRPFGVGEPYPPEPAEIT